MPRLTKDQWRQVRSEWESGHRSFHELATDFNVSHTAIINKSKEEGWEKVSSKLPEVSSLARAREAEYTDVVVLQSFERVISLLHRHRKFLARLFSSMEKAMDRHDALIAKKAAENRALTLKEEKFLSSILSDHATIMARLIPLERSAFGLNDGENPSEFDRLTTEQQEMLIRMVMDQLRKG